MQFKIQIVVDGEYGETLTDDIVTLNKSTDGDGLVGMSLSESKQVLKRLQQDWLGDIVRKIREGGNQHPAKDMYDELDQINDYTSQYHHGEDLVDVTPDQIDPQELTGYVRRTLRLVNALQA